MAESARHKEAPSCRENLQATNLQHPEKHQIPITKSKQWPIWVAWMLEVGASLDVGVWSFSDSWCLVLLHTAFTRIAPRRIFCDAVRRMKPQLSLISTDFDGTIFAEFEKPPIPAELQQLIGELQAGGASWVINTRRDMSSPMARPS